jgi:serine/threonine protein kinase/tetratricopeptide (TPR) repeat protein
MDDLLSESNKPRVPKDEASYDAQVALDSKPPASSLPPNRHDLAAMLQAEATVIGNTPIRPDTSTAHTSFPDSSSAETVVSPAPLRNNQSSNISTILLDVGTILGERYELLELLGQGGMGAVYKAADREVDRLVALKVIRPEMAANPDILARFKQELLLSSKVTDRHVIRIYDLGEAQGVKFITMEYIEGENLHAILKQHKKLEIAEAASIMEQVATGLAAAHREGIIHRDLKPANIMRDKSGRVVLMDFGLARTFAGDGMTQTGMMLGTMEYMSPEQAQGMDVKASSDIFTVGLILYELLAGVPAFYAESAIASLLMRTQKRAAPLIDIDRTIPGPLSDIVSKCLESDPLKRYQSAEDLVADLRAWQGHTGFQTISAPTAPRESSAKKSSWPRVAIASTVAIALAAGSIWYFTNKRYAATPVAHGPVSVLIGDFANHTGDSVLDNTLEPMLGVAMEGASFINVYSRGDARKFAKKLPNPTDVLDEQSSRLVAMNQGVNAVITGEINLRGDQYEISAIALDSHTGNVLAKADVTAPGKQEILSELPKLAVPIRKSLGDTTPASVQFEKVSGGFTASSIAAVHQDSLGVEAQFAGKYQDAFDFFKRSADLDPKFARAYTGMAAMARNLGKPDDAINYMKLAMANVNRMTERERYRNQGLYYLTLGDWQNCVAQYTQLVDRYPADRVGQNNLANCYTQLRNAPKALEAARHAVEIVPKGVGQLQNFAFIAAFAGDFVTSEKEGRVALDISPGASQTYLVLAEAKTGQGQVKEASDFYHLLEKSGASGASTANFGLADLAAYQGNYSEAATLLTQGIASDLAAKDITNAARKYAALANIEQLQGHQPAALANIGKALAASQSTQIRMLAGLLYAEAGDLPKAQKNATSLTTQPSSEPQAYGKIILGLIALKKKDLPSAISQITSANSLLDTWIGHFELGRAYLDAGKYTEADSEFSQCLKRRGEAIELFDDNVPTYANLPPVYFYQGRARQGGKSAQFDDSYKSYLGIRGQSPDDPLLLEVRHQLGR